MTDKPDEKIAIVLFETALSAFIIDSITVGWLLAGFYLNYRFIDGNNFVDLILFILFFTALATRLISRTTGLIKRMTFDEARKFLNEKGPAA